MGQLVLLAIDNAHTVSQRALDYGPGLGELDQVYEHNRPNLTITWSPLIWQPHHHF